MHFLSTQAGSFTVSIPSHDGCSRVVRGFREPLFGTPLSRMLVILERQPLPP